MKYSNELYLKHKDKIKDLLDNKFNELTSRYEFYDIPENEDIDYKPYDGYIPFTNSGYEISGFTDLYNNWIEDKLPKSCKDILEKNIDKWINEAKQDELTDNEIKENEREILEDTNLLFTLRVQFYHANNFHNNFKNQDSVYIYGEINWEAPYYRPGKGHDIYFEKGFTIDDNFYETLEKELTEIVEKMI